jgi:hypothetical protein
MNTKINNDLEELERDLKEFRLENIDKKSKKKDNIKIFEDTKSKKDDIKEDLERELKELEESDEKENKKVKDKKQNLGQFYTTNYKYILQDLTIPKEIKKIIEPFCGNGDLLNIVDKKIHKIECYDIDPKKDFIIKRDTISNPPSYKNSFVITNPPYLSRNKSKNKEMFDKYDVNDLYKCHIKDLISNQPKGGILIIPLNFFCSIRLMDIELRKNFLNLYKIIQLNIFEETVFNDTTYTVCSFQYEYNINSNEKIPITIYPSKKKISFYLNKDNNYTIGGEIYNIKKQENYIITRLIEKGKPNTNIILKAIDDNEESKIKLEIVKDEDVYYGKTTSRTYATLLIEPHIDLKTQQNVVNDFNKYINDMRDKYNSLFLTNYRESKKIARKRISFDLVYKIVGMFLQEYKNIEEKKKNHNQES